MKTIRADELTAADIGKIVTVSDSWSTTVSGILTAVEFRGVFVTEPMYGDPDPAPQLTGTEMRVSVGNQSVRLADGASVVVES